MSYEAKVIEVMIASPSDVPQERRIAREAILEWNSIHARDRATVLMPLGWETHSSPNTGDRPQALINGQILKHADLLVAIFWTRLGTSTGVAPSGTVEEIEEHIKAGKPAMIYFSSAPVQYHSVDSQQYAALQKFKESLKDRGLYEHFESLDEFESKFKRQLAINIIEKFSAIEASEVPFSATDSPFRRITFGENATRLLIEATKDPQGVILSVRDMAGLIVQTNQRQFVKSGNARDEAAWASALRDLIDLGLVEDRSGKGQAFRVTDSGFRTADDLIKKFPDLADDPPASPPPSSPAP